MSHHQSMGRLKGWISSFLERAFLIRLGALVALAGIIGGFVLVSGIMPVKASSGHWPITHWLLSFASQRSIATNSIGLESPVALNDPALVRLGAAHYESGCQWCHGSPDERGPRVPMAMTPAPPYLPESMDRWDDGELFYIVKHGIKFTGMPAWPSRVRDDDVWPVVAFLRSFSDIDAEQYRRLVARDVALPLGSDAVTPAIQQCIACHGSDGNYQIGEWVPKLAGQSQAYLETSLEAYANGTRHSGIMEPIAAKLQPNGRKRLAEHFASQRAESILSDHDDDNVLRRGEAIALGKAMQAKRPIPGCVHCHQFGADERYPQLAGQPAGYLQQQLRLFQSHQRGGTHARRMYPTVDLLNEQDIHAVAIYYSTLDP